MVGLTGGGRRRTPGLRREEVAMLAGVSTDYYVRLEQGRERRPSEQVLDALARVLDLDADATEHLYELAHPRPRRRLTDGRAERVSPNLLRLLMGWEATPAVVHGRYMDVLATNRLADALYAGLANRDNLIRMTFLDPGARDLYPDWEKIARDKTAHLRSAATDPDDPYLPSLVEELSAHSEEFRRLWARHDVGAKTRERKRFHHPDVGDLDLSYESFTVNSAPGQQLLIFQADPGSASEYALGLLGALVADGSARAPGSAEPDLTRFSPPVLGGRGSPPMQWRTKW